METISKEKINDLLKEIKDTISTLNINEKKKRVDELKNISIDPNLWNNQNNAKKVIRELEHLKKEIESSELLEKRVTSLSELANTIQKDSEEEQSFITEEFNSLKSDINKFQTLKFLSGKYDQSDAILSIHSGQGGTEANDWTEMLFRMYTRFCDRQDWRYEVQHMVRGTETGISTVTMIIEGEFAFGMLKKETGAHRLVRQSPFNAQNLRQTSFAGVEVIPIIDDDDEIEIKSEDIDFKAVRASGAGGQHVNKASTAVQITHIPTGITVHNSESRSQTQNRENAMKILKSKLWLIEEEKRQKEISNIKGEHKVAGWGNQIRNYVLHPYKLVKDLRTNIERSDPETVLDGDLEEFIDAEIRIS